MVAQHCLILIVGIARLSGAMDASGAHNKDFKTKFFTDAQVNCNGVVTSSQGEVLSGDYDHGCHFPDDCRGGPEFCAGVTEPPCPCSEHGTFVGKAPRLVVLTQQWPGAYYHDVVEALSRLTHLKKEYADIFEDESTLFHIPNDEKLHQWAQLLGINTTWANSRLVWGCWAATSLVYPPSNPCFNPDEEAVQGMQATLQTSIEGLHAASLTSMASLDLLPSKPLALIVQRSKTRVVENQNEIVDALQALGFQIQIFDDQTLPDVPEQCNMFNQADLIIGPHGAGFTNLICAKPQSWLIEFQQEPHQPCYETLSGKLAMHYVGIQTGMGHEANTTVNVQQVEELAQQAMKSFMDNQQSSFSFVVR